MTQPNESELEQLLTTKANYNRLTNEDGSCVMCGIEPSALLAYITANYTPKVQTIDLSVVPKPIGKLTKDKEK